MVETKQLKSQLIAVALAARDEMPSHAVHTQRLQRQRLHCKLCMPKQTHGIAMGTKMAAAFSIGYLQGRFRGTTPRLPEKDSLVTFSLCGIYQQKK